MRRIGLGAMLFVGFMLGAAAVDDFQREGERAAKDALEGKAPPALQVKGWVNTDGKEINLADFKGKVVVLDFWGVWCGPCKAAMPHLKELLEKHKDRGLVVIGIHTTQSGDQMAAYVDQERLPWPSAIDVNDKTVEAFKIDSFPDYCIIDRAGNLRVVDLANADLDRAVEALLSEKAQ